MQKRALVFGAFLCLSLLLSISFAYAQAENETEGEDSIAKAYSCLEGLVKNKTLSLPEAVFSVLALKGGSKPLEKIDSEKKVEKNGTCWPKSSCKIKETAQVGLAYERMGRGSEEVQNWLSQKSLTTTELSWYLEIDIPNRVGANCTIKRGKETGNANIGENMRISPGAGGLGSCFAIDASGYLLKINSNCYDNEFEISCNQDFVTTVLYQKSTGGALFVSSETHSSASLGNTKESLKAKCFKMGASCDYEGTLWASFFLSKAEKDVSKYMPYLLAFAEDNTKYFPPAFLNIVVGGEEQFAAVIQAQKQGKFWEMTATPYNRFYDTSLAMLSLASRQSAEVESAKNYLLEIQGSSGCWNSNNMRDTAFILYSAPDWARETGEPSEPGVPGGGEGKPACEAPYSCGAMFACTDSGGNILDYECENQGDYCCSIEIKPGETCEQKGGLKCSENQECTEGTIEYSSDGTCCIGGSCTEIQQPPSDPCAVAEGTCRESCDEGEEEISETCDAEGTVCCKLKAEGGGTSALVWILLLLILIVLVVIAIIYRDKLKLWWFKIKERFKKKPSGPGAPAGGMPAARPQMMPRILQPTRYYPRPVARPAPARASPRDREVEETLKKLKEIGK